MFALGILDSLGLPSADSHLCPGVLTEQWAPGPRGGSLPQPEKEASQRRDGTFSPKPFDSEGKSELAEVTPCKALCERPLLVLRCPGIPFEIYQSSRD